MSFPYNYISVLLWNNITQGLNTILGDGFSKILIACT